MSQDEPTPWFAIKKPALLMWRPVSLLSSFSLQYLFSTNVTTSHWFNPSITVFFKKCIYSWYLIKCFLSCLSPLSTSSNNIFKVKKH